MPYPYVYTFPYDPVPVYTVKIDWDNDGDFADTGEDMSDVYIHFKVDQGRDQAWELAKGRASVCEILVDNISKAYSPEYSSSPIYGDVKPGRPVEITVTFLGTTYTLFSGFLYDFKLYPDKKRREILFIAEDGMTRMRNQKVHIKVYEGITTGVAIGHVLDALGWPAGKRSIDTGQTTLAYWWAWDISGIQSIRELEATEMGLFYLDGEGNAVFEDRHHKLKGAHLSSQETYGPDNRIYSGFKYEMGTRNIFNRATATIKIFSEAALAVLWTLDENAYLPPGDVRTFRAVFSSGAVDLATPVEGTDYIAHTLPAGAGAVISSDISVSLTDLGQGADLEVTNNGAVGAYLTLLQQRAKLLSYAQTSCKEDNASSQTDNDIRTYPLPGAWIPDELQGRDFCNYAVNRYGVAVPQIKLAIWNGTEADMIEILTRKVSDLITVENAELGMDTTFFIHNIRHTVRRQGTLHTVEIAVEKASSEAFWIIGTSQLDIDTRLAY